MLPVLQALVDALVLHPPSLLWHIPNAAGMIKRSQQLSLQEVDLRTLAPDYPLSLPVILTVFLSVSHFCSL